VDAFADLLADLRTAGVTARFGDEAAKKTYNEEKEPRFLASIDRYLAQRNGPYIIGNEPTYADFIAYALLVDIQPDTANLPHIKTFLESLGARPAIKNFKKPTA
jgi:glutathione S-transferase